MDPITDIKDEVSLQLPALFIFLFNGLFFLNHKVRVAWHPVFAVLPHTLCKVWRRDTQPADTKVCCCCGVFAQAGLQRVL